MCYTGSMTNECPYCYNSGIQSVPDGDEDYTEEFCYCEHGDKLLKQAEDYDRRKRKKDTEASK